MSKLTSNKDVIAFLANKFPLCFSTDGAAKPLKIGIFQDLSERLADDDAVSKTTLRSALRHYTNSWRYLESLQVGAYRVNLDGEQGAVIEEQHAEHAKKQLTESKAKAAERKKATPPKASLPTKSKEEPREKSPSKLNKRANAGTKRVQSNSKPKVVPARLTSADLVAGTKVTVKLGKAPVVATIVEVQKSDVQVQLETGMLVKVKPEALRIADAKRQ